VVVFTVEQGADRLTLTPSSIILATRNGGLPYRAFGRGPEKWRYRTADMRSYGEGQDRTGVGSWSNAGAPRTVMAAPKVRRT